ncbi:MAG: SpoIIE family protein phosphatase [Methanomicrobiales archaeon]
MDSSTMALLMFDDLLVLVQMICVIVVAAYLLTRCRIFTDVLEGHPTVKAQVLLTLVFGALSIYGTMSGITVLGAPVNVRDLGPMVAGLTCGPFVGLGAGLIGAAYRMMLEGFTVYACSLATVLAGLFGGLVWLFNNKKFPGIRISVEFAVMMEGLHMLLVLIIATPFAMALALVSAVAVPMIIANSLGMFIFSFIITNLQEERKTRGERDNYLRDIERKNTELAIAADIQKSFLPSEIEPLIGFDIEATSIPAKEVGGDFFDVIPFAVIPAKDHKTGIMIADVSGKGIPAALFMALSLVIMRVNSLWHPHPADVLRGANDIISEDSKTGMFVTLFYAVIDCELRQVTYANAGHNPPMVYRAGTGVIEELGTTGVALGIMDLATYTEQVCVLSPGDILLLYTDGITEADNEAEEMFGEERLREGLVRYHAHPARMIMDSVLEDVRAFAAGYPQSDDITLMVLKAVEDK